MGERGKFSDGPPRERRVGGRLGVEGSGGILFHLFLCLRFFLHPAVDLIDGGRLDGIRKEGGGVAEKKKRRGGKGFLWLVGGGGNVEW